MNYLKFIMCAISLVSVAGCDIFNTRNPEEPDTGRSSFQPPTQPSVVVSNLKNAIGEKNIDNYLLCLSGSTVDSTNVKFIFQPSVEGNTLFPGIFENWGIDNEKKYFNSLKSKMPADVNPLIVLKNERFGVSQPDSVVVSYEYYIKINFIDNSIGSEYSGTMQLTMIPQKNGLWSIYRWQDIKSQADTADSWSILKGNMIN